MEEHFKTVCYTAITGGYDRLLDPVVQAEGVDYVCFSDQPVKSDVWRIRDFPKELAGLDRVKRQRIVKICPHRYLPEYDVSVWVDGNIQVVGDVNEFLKLCDFSKSSLYVRPHPSRTCVYEEAEAVLRHGKEDPALVRKLVERYKAEGYPEKIGMAETNVLARLHNDAKCRLFDEAWATELLLNSKRDQLSFNYMARKTGFLPGYLTGQFSMLSSEYFKIKAHHG